MDNVPECSKEIIDSDASFPGSVKLTASDAVAANSSIVAFVQRHLKCPSISKESSLEHGHDCSHMLLYPKCL